MKPETQQRQKGSRKDLLSRHTRPETLSYSRCVQGGWQQPDQGYVQKQAATVSVADVILRW